MRGLVFVLVAFGGLVACCCCDLLVFVSNSCHGGVCVIARVCVTVCVSMSLQGNGHRIRATGVSPVKDYARVPSLYIFLQGAYMQILEV